MICVGCATCSIDQTKPISLTARKAFSLALNYLHDVSQPLLTHRIDSINFTVQTHVISDRNHNWWKMGIRAIVMLIDM